MKELDVMRACMLALSSAGCIVWRNNTGVLPDKHGRPVRFGLCVGSADIIGIAQDGRFLAVEVKAAHGKPTPVQLNFLEQVRRAGGIAGIARTPAEALALLSEAQK